MKKKYKTIMLAAGCWVLAAGVSFFVVFTSIYLGFEDFLIKNLGSNLYARVGWIVHFFYFAPSLCVFMFLPFSGKAKIFNGLIFLIVFYPITALFSFAIGMAIGGVYP